MDLSDPKSVEAQSVVQKLLESKIVYRIFKAPVTNIKLPIEVEVQYSIRGYFIPVAGSSYQFITNLPLRQYWTLDTQVRVF